MQVMQTETGTMVAATPETTAFDLARFSAACGSWSNVATIVAELAETLGPAALVSGAARVARSDVQRLRWLLKLSIAVHGFITRPIAVGNTWFTGRADVVTAPGSGRSR